MTRPDNEWTMFSSSREEIAEMMRPDNAITIYADSIMVEQCLYKPSVAYPSRLITAQEIQSIETGSFPPNIRVNNELIFITAKKKEDLKLFAAFNNISIVNRADIWSWLLEPFLDTKYTKDTDRQLAEKLLQFGLGEQQVSAIRQEVEVQMLKYNFDTVLWEWVHLNLYDVLKAMRTKYDDDTFADFYQRAMAVALLPDNIK